MTNLYWLCKNSALVASKILFGFSARGLDKIPKSGAFIIAPNHQSYLDPPFLGAITPREIHFFAKAELFKVFGLGLVIRNLNAFPVRRGVYDPAAISMALAALEKGHGLLIFPEGTRDNGEAFLPAKPGIGMIAKRSGAQIVPAYLYRSHKIWGALLARRHMKIVFGEPIPADAVARHSDDREGYQAIADEVLTRIGALKNSYFPD